MADDLEAFLRQAAQRRAQRQKPPAQRRPAVPARAEPVQPKRVKPPVRSAVPEATVVEDAMVIPETEPSRLGKRIGTADFEQRADHMGEEVEQADEEMEAHIEEKFDHQIGRLRSEDRMDAPAYDEQEVVATVKGAQLAELLRDPMTVRQAFLLAEILPRPEHRW